MAHIEADRVRETTASTGVGAVTLAGAVAGFRAFASVMANADTCYYCIAGSTEWEVGTGTYSAGTLTRNAVFASSNAGALVAFSAGSKDVFITLPADRTVSLEPSLALPMMGVAAEPPTPGAGFLLSYAKSVAGRMVPKVKGPSGLDYPLQASFWQNNITMWNPTNAIAGVWLGTVGTGTGTFGVPAISTINTFTTVKRGRYANVVNTLNQVLGQRNTESMYFRGAGQANQGGFFFYARAGMDAWTNGGRFFAGMHTSTAVISADPSLHNNSCGFCVDAADNGAISFYTRSGSTTTKVATGFSFTTNAGFDFYIFVAPSGAAIGWRIVNINTQAENSGSVSTNLPVNTTTFTAGVLASNAALTPVGSIQLGINRIYVETDY